MDGGRNHVVTGLSHVHMVIGMDRIFQPDRLARDLTHAIRDHLVGVHVGAGAGTGLENVERKAAVQLSLDNLFRSLNDEACTLSVESLTIPIGLGGAPLDKPERANQWTTKAISADGKIEDRALGGGAIQG